MIEIDKNELMLINQNYAEATEKVIEKSYRQARIKTIRQVKTFLSSELRGELRAKAMNQRVKAGKAYLWIGQESFDGRSYKNIKKQVSEFKSKKTDAITQRSFLTRARSNKGLIWVYRAGKARNELKGYKVNEKGVADQGLIAQKASERFEAIFYNLYTRQLEWNLKKS